jgi:hypothetical protein
MEPLVVVAPRRRDLRASFQQLERQSSVLPASRRRKPGCARAHDDGFDLDGQSG